MQKERSAVLHSTDAQEETKGGVVTGSAFSLSRRSETPPFLGSDNDKEEMKNHEI